MTNCNIDKKYADGLFNPRTKGNETYLRILAVLLNIVTDIFICLKYDTTSILIVDIGSILLLLYYAKKIKNAPIGKIILIKLLLIGFAVIQCNAYTAIYGNIYYNGGSDDLYFEKTALSMMERNLYLPWQVLRALPNINESGFIAFLAFFIRVTRMLGGYHPFAFIILNINIWCLTSLMVQKYLNRHYGDKPSNRICILLLLSFPNAVYISAHVFRDTLCAFLIFLGFTLADRSNKVKGKYTLLLIVIALSFYVRRECALMLVSILSISTLKESVTGVKRIVLLMLLCTCLFVLAYALGIVTYSVDKFARYMEYTTSTDNGIINALYGMPLLPFGWLARSMYGLISPLPTGLFEIGNFFSDYYAFRNVLISVGVTVQILFLPFLFKRIIKLDYTSLSFLLVYLSNRLVTSGFRHIILSYPFIFIMMYEQYEITSHGQRNRLFMASTSALILLGLVFAFLFY